MFGSHLQGTDGCPLKAQVGFEVLGDLTHQALEWELADEQLSGLLVAPDLTQGHGTRPECHEEEGWLMWAPSRLTSTLFLTVAGTGQILISL